MFIELIVAEFCAETIPKMVLEFFSETFMLDV
jgi:hypothetical protein